MVEISNNKFHYFAYGSNLLKNRILLQNPSVQYFGIGLVDDHILKICKPPKTSKVWFSDSATIVKEPGRKCYGAIWILSNSDIESLDEQECVKDGVYSSFEIDVLSLSHKSIIPCRCYRLEGDCPGEASPYYLDIILRGATQMDLPIDYIDYIRTLPINNYNGPCKKYDEILNTMSEKERIKYELESLKTREISSTKFLYFAYGSNLLRERIVYDNPSAKFLGVAHAQGYRVKICQRNSPCVWSGGTASIIEDIPHKCSGVIWTLEFSERENLDKQEGVSIKLYYPFEIEVSSEYFGTKVKCLCYRMNDETPGITSSFYWDIVLRGAIQSGLPCEYINELKSYELNEFLGPCFMYEKILATISEEERDKFQIDNLRNRIKSFSN